MTSVPSDLLLSQHLALCVWAENSMGGCVIFEVEKKAKKKKAWCSLIEADLDKEGEKMKLTATKAPPNNTYHGSFPTALSNTMKHLQKAHSVNTFPKCGVLETEKTEGALVCCLVGK